MSDERPAPHLYDALSLAARRLAAVPRIGNMIGCLSPAHAATRLTRCATEADVYWEVYTYIPNDSSEDCGILWDGLKAVRSKKLARRDKGTGPKPRHQVNRACALLGAIAFEMLAQVDAAGEPAPAFNGMAADTVYQRTLQRFHAAEALVTYSGRPETQEAAVFDAYFEQG